MQSLSSTEGLLDSSLEEFDPSSGICLPPSTPRRAVSLGCRRYPYGRNVGAGSARERCWQGSKRRQAGGPCLQLGQHCWVGEGFLSTLIWQLASAARKTPEPFRVSFCGRPCTHICEGDRCSCLVPVCAYGWHLSGLQPAWPASPSTTRQPVTQCSGRMWGTHCRAEARGRQPKGGVTLLSALSGCWENWLYPEPQDTQVLHRGKDCSTTWSAPHLPRSLLLIGVSTR